MSAYLRFSDQELVQLLQENDRLAFGQIYDRYRGLLYVYACKIAKDEDVAEDLVQEIFIYLWDKRNGLHLKTSLASYLYGAIRYRFFDLVDKQKVRADYVAAFQSFIDRAEPLTDQYMAEKELADIIEKEVDQLPPKMREIFVLSRTEQLSNKEIAAYLGISEKTVKNQIGSALKILRKKLGLLLFLYMLDYLG